jgi:hypothetical protein
MVFKHSKPPERTDFEFFFFINSTPKRNIGTKKCTSLQVDLTARCPSLLDVELEEMGGGRVHKDIGRYRQGQRRLGCRGRQRGAAILRINYSHRVVCFAKASGLNGAMSTV